MSMTKEQYIAKHFPEVDPGSRPPGTKILVQLRTMAAKSKGGILLANDTKDFNQGNTRVCRLIKMGEMAYRHRDTFELWPEGVWANVGDIVIMPAWGGFRFEVPIPDSEDKAIFAVYKDHEIELVVHDNFEAYDKLL